MEQNKQKIKHRHIYSKDKTPYIVTREKPQNVMDRLCLITKKQNVWSDFISRVVYNKEIISLPIEENIKNIIDLITDKNIGKQIVKNLMGIEGYNPFKDKIPLDKLPTTQLSLVQQVQEQLRQSNIFIEELLENIKLLCYEGIVYDTLLVDMAKIPNKDIEINKLLYERNIDVIISYGNGKFIISTNPRSIFRPYLAQAFLDLYNKEPDVWFLHKNQHLIYTKDEKPSVLSAEVVFETINQR